MRILDGNAEHAMPTFARKAFERTSAANAAVSLSEWDSLFAGTKRIARRIFVVRGRKVMIDADLAELYGVPTKALNQAVKRNLDRFPADFMFQLSPAEKQEVVTNCDHLGKLKYSPVRLPRS